MKEGIPVETGSRAEERSPVAQLLGYDRETS